ncbi:hypothetical protein RxyAA322_07630 [Rubrobacter xylanophilus]|uniref:Copper transporter n=1 Tax=Rubrobacter xylanophilus TaxID=49319 RepID=A0A510HG30_9ACTN|nr:copper transporter [Rubrobacter xylanophilus]BBL78909.1 hypothetical protein RxyAA322_07630 [Rubrobacter xylanophilus]
MPDLRYHVISLVAVFLALAVGILLGVAMADRGVISARLQAEITDVSNRLNRQQTQMERLRERTAEDEQLMQGMAEHLISGRLLGLRVALVSGPYADPEVVQDVQSDLLSAGAELSGPVTLEAPADRSEVSAPGGETTPLAETYLATAREVLRSPEADGIPPDAIVFVGGGGIPPDAPPGTPEALNEAQARMLELFASSGVRVVAAEASGPARSEVELFQSAGVPSVDNADDPAGRAAIVQLILSEDDGSYGTKETASDFFPPPPED